MTTKSPFLWAGLNTGPESPTPATYLQDNEEGIFTSVALFSSGSDNSCVLTWPSGDLLLVPYILFDLHDLTLVA